MATPNRPPKLVLSHGVGDGTEIEETPPPTGVPGRGADDRAMVVTRALRELATAEATGVIHNVSISTSHLALT